MLCLVRLDRFDRDAVGRSFSVDSREVTKLDGKAGTSASRHGSMHLLGEGVETQGRRCGGKGSCRGSIHRLMRRLGEIWWMGVDRPMLHCLFSAYPNLKYASKRRRGLVWFRSIQSISHSIDSASCGRLDRVHECVLADSLMPPTFVAFAGRSGFFSLLAAIGRQDTTGQDWTGLDRTGQDMTPTGAGVQGTRVEGIVGLTLFVLKGAGHRRFCLEGWLFDCTCREATLLRVLKRVVGSIFLIFRAFLVFLLLMRIIILRSTPGSRTSRHELGRVGGKEGGGGEEREACRRRESGSHSITRRNHQDQEPTAEATECSRVTG